MLLGFVSLLLMTAIGIFRGARRLKKEEFGEFSFIKWILGGWALLGFFVFLDTRKNGGGDEKVLAIVTIGFTIATIVSMIVEKIAIGNNLRKQKLKEYNKSKDKWE